jgi:(R,R)-butanediol dehydrogenase/meso-butanediol dehydrogenase/diacetyl reductase
MRAAVFHAAGDVRIEDVPEPERLGARQVLVRPTWCGICGTDLHEFLQGPIVIPAQPHPLTGARLPQVLGHELSATVVEVGDEVAGVRPGDRVSVMPLIVCGRCPYCLRGLNHLCVDMACTGLSSASGGMAELAVLEDYQVAVLPDAVSDVQGALIEPAAVAAYGVDRAQVHPGDVVLITGAGPIGALAALYAVAGGMRVVVAEPNPNRAAFARELGVGPVVDPTEEDGAALRAAIDELSGGLGADAAVECAGSAPALNAAIANVRSRGTVVQTGLHTRPAEIDPMQISLRDLSLVGTWCYPIQDWPRMVRLLGTGRFPVERIVTSQIDVSAVVEQGFEPLTDPRGAQLKVLVSAGA